MNSYKLATLIALLVLIYGVAVFALMQCMATYQNIFCWASATVAALFLAIGMICTIVNLALKE